MTLVTVLNIDKYIKKAEEEFEKLNIFSAPMPKECDIYTFVLDIQEVKDFYSAKLKSAYSLGLKDGLEKAKSCVPEEKEEIYQEDYIGGIMEGYNDCRQTTLSNIDKLIKEI